MSFLTRLRDLDARATPGPWAHVPDSQEPDNVMPRDGGFIEDHDMGRVAVLDLTAEDPADGYVAGWRHGHNGDLLVLLRNSAPRLAALVEAVAKAVQSVPPSFFDAANAPSGPDQTVAYGVDYSHLVNLRAAITALDTEPT